MTRAAAEPRGGLLVGVTGVTSDYRWLGSTH
jgi:hypothetical protein